jgi:hypothetical protein
LTSTFPKTPSRNPSHATRRPIARQRIFALRIEKEAGKRGRGILNDFQRTKKERFNAMDFRTLVIEAFDRVVAAGTVEKIIEEQLAKTIKEVVYQQLREYSDFGGQLKEAVAKSFGLNGELDLPSYNDAILKIVRKQVTAYTNNVIQQQVASNLEKLLEPPPAEITVSALVKKYVEFVKDRRSGSCVCYGENQITLIDDSHDSYFRYIHLDDEPNKKKYECDIQIGISRGEVFSLRFKNQDVEKQLFAGPLHGFEEMLFQMKAAKTKVIFDVDLSEVETAYSVGHED